MQVFESIGKVSGRKFTYTFERTVKVVVKPELEKPFRNYQNVLDEIIHLSQYELCKVEELLKSFKD